MLSTKLKEAAGNGADATLYVDDVFSTWLYTGNNSTQTITNGIDLAGKGGLVWVKSRTNTYGHSLTNQVGKYLDSSDIGGMSDQSFISSFNSDGFSLGSGALSWNGSSNYASWTFRKAAKFFDVVTYTGTGGGNRQISHSLGTTVGMIIVKRTDTTRDWNIYQRSISPINQNNMQLNTTSATSDGGQDQWGNGITVIVPTSTQFTVGVSNNASGGTYVAYLFAHDTSSTGIIQCGSFTTDGSGNATVNLGWEPQYLMVKNASTDSNWYIVDSMRGFTTEGSVDNYLYANNSLVEDSSSIFSPTATGFKIAGWWSSATVIYMAIRRPNKPPTTGTQVYNPIKQAGGGTVTTGFPVDLSINTKPTSAFDRYAVDRLRGVSKTTFPYLLTDTTGAEVAVSGYGFGFDNNTGYLDNGVYGSGETPIYWNFKRAPGFFDEVCYTGTGTGTGRTNHNLTVLPELIITKCRTSNNWVVYSSTLGFSKYLLLNSTNAQITGSAYTYTSTTEYSMPSDVDTSTYVSYLFATLAGISKVGSYTGNGSSQNIECGFAAGARFFLVKATSTTGSWWVWDSARGITAGNDPALQLNSTAAEITTADAVDPYSPGITVNQEATCSINANGVSYIFLAVA